MTSNRGVPLQQHCLFSAPASFIPGIEQSYTAVLPTTFTEIWSREELRAFPNVTAWIVNPGARFIVDADVLDRYFPALRVIVTPSTGVNHIDAKACAERNIAVFGLLNDRAGVESISASAEFTFLLLMDAYRRLEVALGEVSAGRWRQREEAMRGHELYGKRIGLVGMGRIGRRMTRYCTAFEATVQYHDPYVKNEALQAVDLPTLFETSDAVCVCCVLTDETRGMIGGDLVRRLPQGGRFVNTSRGEVLDEASVAAALRERPDIVMAADVIAGEVSGSQFQSPLMDLQREGRVIVTPHIAGATVESQAKAALTALGILQRHLQSSAG